MSLEKYESIRQEVYKQLKVKHIQKLVANKLLKKETKEVELIFTKDTTFEDTSSEDELVSDNKESDSSSETEEEAVHSSAPFTNTRITDISRYLDLQAECSKEENSDELEEGSSIIDNNCSNNIKLDQYNRDRNKKDEDIIRRLQSQYMKRPEVKKIKGVKLIESEEDSFPSFQTMEEDIVVTNKRKEIKNKITIVPLPKVQESTFIDKEAAIKRLSKKEKKQYGFKIEE